MEAEDCSFKKQNNNSNNCSDFCCFQCYLYVSTDPL